MARGRDEPIDASDTIADDDPRAADLLPPDFEATLPDPLRAHRRSIENGTDAPTVPEDAAMSPPRPDSLRGALFAPAGTSAPSRDGSRPSQTVSYRSTVPRDSDAAFSLELAAAARKHAARETQATQQAIDSWNDASGGEWSRSPEAQAQAAAEAAAPELSPDAAGMAREDTFARSMNDYLSRGKEVPERPAPPPPKPQSALPSPSPASPPPSKPAFSALNPTPPPLTNGVLGPADLNALPPSLKPGRSVLAPHDLTVPLGREPLRAPRWVAPLYALLSAVIVLLLVLIWRSFHR
jgi:hypothetical protein